MRCEIRFRLLYAHFFFFFFCIAIVGQLPLRGFSMNLIVWKPMISMVDLMTIWRITDTRCHRGSAKKKESQLTANPTRWKCELAIQNPSQRLDPWPYHIENCFYKCRMSKDCDLGSTVPSVKQRNSQRIIMNYDFPKKGRQFLDIFAALCFERQQLVDQFHVFDIAILIFLDFK